MPETGILSHGISLNSVELLTSGLCCTITDALSMWDVATGNLLRELAVQTDCVLGVTAVAWSPDSAFVAVTPGDVKVNSLCAVNVWVAATGVATHMIGGQEFLVSSVAWNHDGSMLAAGAALLTDQVSDTATGYVKHSVEGGSMAGAVAWSTDGCLLAIATKEGSVKIWKMAWRRFTRVIHVSGGGELHSVAWGPCGRFVFVAALSGTVHIYNVS